MRGGEGRIGELCVSGRREEGRRGRGGGEEVGEKRGG